MYSDDLPYWLVASFMKLRSFQLRPWLCSFPTIKSFFNASVEELLSIGLRDLEINKIKNINWKEIEKALKWAEEKNHHLLTLGDEHYPYLLKQTVDPPLVLYIRGNKEALHSVQIAIVGSRHATPSGLKNAEQFAFQLAEGGVSITSGLAIGIDGASHQGALKANGITLAVCGTGLSHIYPRIHHRLAQEILDKNGVIISEFALDTPPFAQNFPQRNRIIGGLSSGVLVVEAALKSGSLITARLALEEGREVFAIPGSIHNPQARGCHYLLRQGAKLVEDVADIFEELNIKKIEHANTVVNLKAEYKKILEQIDYDITAMDVIVLRSGLTMSELSSILLTLEFENYIQSVRGGFIRLK